MSCRPRRSSAVLGAAFVASMSLQLPQVSAAQSRRHDVVIAPIEWRPRTSIDSTFASDVTKALLSAVHDSGFTVTDIRLETWDDAKGRGMDYVHTRYRNQEARFLVWGDLVTMSVGGEQHVRVQIRVDNLDNNTTKPLETGAFLADLDTAKARFASLADDAVRALQGRPPIKSVLAACFRVADPDMVRRFQMLPTMVAHYLQTAGFEKAHNVRVEGEICSKKEPRRKLWSYTIGGTVLPVESNPRLSAVSLIVATSERRGDPDNGFRANPRSNDFFSSLATYIMSSWCRSLVSC